MQVLLFSDFFCNILDQIIYLIMLENLPSFFFLLMKSQEIIYAANGAS